MFTFVRQKWRSVFLRTTIMVSCVLLLCFVFCVTAFADEETWTCPSCNQERTTKFCPDCGVQRPSTEEWKCPDCDAVNSSKFCSNCGKERPAVDADGYVEDMYIEVQFNSQTRSGKYTGNLENGKPSGEGKFVVEDKNGKLIYEGPWENGEPSGKGHVDIQGYETNAFGDVKDSGYVAEYSGEVLDGVPSGSGQLHIEADGLAADFTGEWKEGEMNGYGELIIHSDPVCHMKGNYSDNDFSPTFAQLVDYLISAQNGYFLKDDQLSFIEENGDLFCGRPNSIPKSKLASSFDSAKFIKTQKAERKLVKVGGTVGQVTSFDLYGIKGEEIIYVGNKGTIYYGYIYGDTDLVVDSKTTLYLYPVSYFTYQTIENVYKQAVLCVYVKTK